jgi:DNA (cytosine-5)-methyltransferase 1
MLNTNKKIVLNSHKLMVLDLFSGIGGFSLALQGVEETKLYCEINPMAIAVLNKHMDKVLINKAPSHGAIFTSQLEKTYNLTVFGLPYVGFSQAGRQKGFDNEQSNLFFEFILMLRGNPSPCLFFENVGAFLFQLPLFAELLTGELGYSLFWFTVTASSVGASHYRERCFILGVHD